MKALIERFFQRLRRKLAGLHRNGGERDEKRNLFCRLEQMTVQEPVPFQSLVRRQVIAEHIEPATDHLLVDAAVGEPFPAALDVAHSRGDRPLRLLSREGKPRAAVFGDGLDGRERALRERLVEQGLRNEVRVGINNHVYLLVSFWPRSALKDAGRDALPLRPRPPPNPLIVAFRSL